MSTWSGHLGTEPRNGADMPRPMRPIFTQEWVDALTPGREAAMPCKVYLYTLGDPQYNEETNTYEHTKTELYNGIARVQPLRTAQQRILPNDNTFVQQVLISVPISVTKSVDFRLGTQARVTEAPLLTSLTKMQYVLQEFMDSGNPIERTFLFTVDQEAVVNGV